MTKEEKAQLLLKKYLNEEASPAEMKQVDNWYTSYEQRTAALNEQRKAQIAEEVFAGLKLEMDQTIRPARVINFRKVFRAAKIAAAVVLIAGLGLTLWMATKQHQAAEQLLSISTTKNERKKIVLSDGSEIRLNPSARLLYPAKFKANDRTIELTEGEAFFNIAHDERRPFTVKTAEGIYTKVLGTSFKIISYRASKNIQIIVATGKVAVGNSVQVFGTLVKGQQVIYDKKEARATISHTPAPAYVNLVFERAALKEVMEKLEYAYDIQIHLAPALNKLKCSATFNTKQTPEEILDLLCSLHHLKFKKTDDQKTFNVYKK
jgi:transmembrane sensor